MARITSLGVSLLALCMYGCGWERKLTFRSSTPRTLVEIQQPFPANGWGIRLMLEDRGKTKTLYQERGDVFLNFADVAWAPNNTSIAILVCGTPKIRMAYSIVESHQIDFQKMAPMLAGHIRAIYHLKGLETDGEILRWACSDEGNRAFLERYPDAIPR